MKKLFQNFFREDGYTYIDTSLSILLMLLISTVIFTQYGRITHFIESSSSDLEQTYQKTQLRSVMLNEISRVLQPWFLHEYHYQEVDNSLIIYYYSGDKESYLELSGGDNGVKILTGDTILFTSTELKGTFQFQDGIVHYSETDDSFQVKLCTTL